MRNLLPVLLLIAAPVSYGQGFLYDAFDARSLGMASAPFASGMGASSIVLNPASVASRQGLFMNVGGMLNLRDADFSGTLGTVPVKYTYATDNGVGAIPQVGFSYGPSTMPIGFGVAVTEPFQMNTAWESGWPGNETVDRFDVHAIYTTLALGYRVNRIISVGAGVHVVSAGFNSRTRGGDQMEGDVFSSSYLIADGAGSSAAVSASLIVAPAPQFSLALGYLTGTNVPVKGTDQTIGATTQSDPFHSVISFPSILSFGIDIHPANAVRIDAGVEFTGWSGFDPMQLQHADSTVPDRYVGLSLKNAVALRMGIEFLLSRSLSLRAGLGYAASAVQDDASAAHYPDAAAFIYSAGVGYQFTKNIRFDLGYRGAAFGARNGTAAPGYNGQYAPSQNLIAASIALAFEPTANPLRASTPKK